MTQPPPIGYASGPDPREYLREVARRQRMIMLCILAYIILVVCQFVVPGPVRLILALLAFGVSVTAAVFVFLLAIKLYGTGAGIVLGILTLIPLIGLIVLLIVNGKATKILREHNISVGLLGADPSRI